MRLIAPILALLLTFSLGATEPRFGSSDRAVAPIEYADPGAAIYNADIATNGEGYLAVWGDSRRGGFDGNIYAARLGADGTLLDPAGIRLGDGFYADVVWTGRTYVVAWTERAAVFIAMVAPDGTVMGRRVLTVGPGSVRPTLASNGTTIAVATTHGKLFILDLNLNVLANRDIATVTRLQNTVSVAARPGQYLVALINAAGVSTRTVTDGGTVSTPHQITESYGANMVATASDGTAYMVVWSTEINMLRAQRMSAANEEIGTGVTLVNGPANPNSRLRVQSPTVEWRDGEYIAAYYFGGGFNETQDLQALRVRTTASTVGSPSPFAQARGIERPNVATKNDGSGAAIWIDDRFRVRVGLFDDVSLASGMAIYKEVSASSAARPQMNPAIVAVERTAVTAWFERATDLQQIRIARVGGAPIIVDQSVPEWLDIVYDGETVTVLWTTSNATELFVRRYTRALEPIDPFARRFAIGDLVDFDSAAAGNGVIAYTWFNKRTGELLLTRLTPAGDTLVQATTRLNPNSTADVDSVVVWDGSHFAIFWRHQYNPQGGEPPTGVEHDSIFAARIAPDGTRENAQPLNIHEVSNSSIYSLRAASNAAGDTVVAWQEAANGGTFSTFAARFENGALTPRKVIEEAIETEWFNWRLDSMAVHRDGEVDLYWYITQDTERLARIRAMRLSEALVQEDALYLTEPFAFVNRPRYGVYENDYEAALDATVIGNSAIFAYERRADGEEGGVNRIFLRGEQPSTSRRRSVR